MVLPSARYRLASLLTLRYEYTLQYKVCPRDAAVKFILPALTEATSPFWRPVKYSLFPPLGLATLAAYLAPDDEATIEDEHVQPLSVDDDAPDLVVIQVYITNAYRAYRLADALQGDGAASSRLAACT